MSLRRVDDDGASAPSIDAAIGAFTNRLPVATRLNHVLTIGAQFRMEQQSKQQQLRSQQRKPVSTDAYPRAGSYRPDPANRPYDYQSYSRWGPTLMQTCTFNPSALYMQHFNAYVAAMNAFMANPNDPNVQWDAIRATQVLANISTHLKKIDYLREKDCYIVLNFMVNAMGPNTMSRQAAETMMRESLHHDKLVQTQVQPESAQDIANKVIKQCQLSQMYLAPHDPRFACDVANYPPFADPIRVQKEIDWNVCEANINAADEAAFEAQAAAQAAAEAAAAQATEAQNNMQPQYQQMPGPGAFQLYQPGEGA